MKAVINKARLLKLCPSKPVTRFAPSSTGYLHLGHVLSLLYVYAVAKAVDARMLVRIENHDTERSKKIYEDAILQDIDWLGIRPHQIVKQSDSPHNFVSAAKKLLREKKTYFCQCSRKDVAEESPRQINQENCYPGRCRELNLPEDKNRRLRFRLDDLTVSFEDILAGEQRQRPIEQCGDMLVRDCRGIYTYNFAVVVDDIIQGVNLIVRGEDLLHCTGRQLLLHRSLGNHNQLGFLHHPLIVDDGGQKLAKRCASESIASMRENGLSPQQIIGRALSLANLCDSDCTLNLDEACAHLIR